MYDFHLDYEKIDCKIVEFAGNPDFNIMWFIKDVPGRGKKIGSRINYSGSAALHLIIINS